VILALIFITFVCTSIDVFTRSRQHNKTKIFSTFSLVHHYNNLMRISESKSQIRCIDGMKVLAAFYIIIGHRMQFTFEKKTYNIMWQKRLKRFILGYHFGIDVFFVCSGVLITKSLLRRFEK
jgi:hypothetical protein